MKDDKVNEVDTEHFIVPFGDLARYFKPGKPARMESFYRKLRASMMY